MRKILIDKKASGIATLYLNRAELHNAFDDETIHLLTEAILQLDEDSQVKVIQLAAKGKSFCAGADLNWMKKMAGYDREQNYQDSIQLANLMHTLYHCTKPTVAICQGAAFGGGVGLVACCDMVIASEKAKFCLSEVKLGLIPAAISPFVVKAIGERQARRFFVSAEIFDAPKAQTLGLVHEVVSHDSLETLANDWSQKLLANGPKAMAEAKKLVTEVIDKPVDESLLKHTAARIADIRASQEGQEGINAFLQKRSPNWQPSK